MSVKSPRHYPILLAQAASVAARRKRKLERLEAEAKAKATAYDRALLSSRDKL